MERLVLSILIILSPVVTRAAGQSGPISGGMDDLAAGIATYFPKAMGVVTTVEADTLSIDIKEGFGLSEGVLLSVYREGAAFYHPVTAVPLGRFEEEISWVEVIDIDSQQVVARPHRPQGPILQGDLVRLTKGRIPIGVTTRGMERDRFLLQEWVVALNETGRFSATILPPESTMDAASALGNLYVITFINGGAAITTQNTKTGKVIFEADVFLRGSDETDFIVESFQRRLFEKYQKGF